MTTLECLCYKVFANAAGGAENGDLHLASKDYGSSMRPRCERSRCDNDRDRATGCMKMDYHIT
ncbi:MAG: hypothetical protein K2X56_01995 [Mycobacterium pseudokansasii]|uniref:hypothetical protein n=1 Tax=Mycobacterium pseudokansasii TaxID=2341080 RepID=UPI0023F25F7A|nr:hypothetical protein [Mycobacterium pseudokansasii]MBY0386903.1 hypothetical protein [Mycobacterium pseudokansasii]